MSYGPRRSLAGTVKLLELLLQKKYPEGADTNEPRRCRQNVATAPRVLQFRHPVQAAAAGLMFIPVFDGFDKAFAQERTVGWPNNRKPGRRSA